MTGLGSSRFARRYLGNRERRVPCRRSIDSAEHGSLLFSFPSGTEMFHFPECASMDITPRIPACAGGFPHSDIFGSKVNCHLPEAYRRLIASFIASLSQGIHRAPLTSPVRRPEYHIILVFLAPRTTFTKRIVPRKNSRRTSGTGL